MPGILLALLLPGCGKADERPEKEALLTRHRLSLGGEEVLRRSLVLAGTYETAKERGRFRILVRRRPFGYREEWFPLNGGARFAVSDGRYVWVTPPGVVLPSTRGRPLPGNVARAVLERAFVEGRLFLEPARIAGRSGVDRPGRLAERKGLPEGMEAGREVDSMHVTTPAGTLVQLHFDREDGRLHEVWEGEVDGRWTRYGAWRTIDGLHVPALRVNGTQRSGVLRTMRIDTVRVGAPQPESIFEGHPLGRTPAWQDGGELWVVHGPAPGTASLALPWVRVNGKAAGLMMIDTGADSCAVTRTLAERLELARGGRSRIATVSTMATRWSWWIDSLVFGDRRALQMPATGIELRQMPQLPAWQQPEFLLGGEELFADSPVFDLVWGRLGFRGEPVKPLSEDAIVVPFQRGRKGSTAIFVDVVVRGARLPAMLDTGMGGMLRLTREAARRAGLGGSRAEWKEHGARQVTIVGASGHETVDLVVRLPSFRLGPIVYRDAPVVLSDPDSGADEYEHRPFVALLGCGALLPFARVGIDWRRGVLELEPGPGIERSGRGEGFVVPGPGVFLGLVLSSPGGLQSGPDSLPVVVVACPGSPAERAGLGLGDRVARIGGFDCEGVPAWKLNRRLWIPEGEHVLIEVRKLDGDLRTVRLP